MRFTAALMVGASAQQSGNTSEHGEQVVLPCFRTGKYSCANSCTIYGILGTNLERLNR